MYESATMSTLTVLFNFVQDGRAHIFVFLHVQSVKIFSEVCGVGDDCVPEVFILYTRSSYKKKEEIVLEDSLKIK